MDRLLEKVGKVGWMLTLIPTSYYGVAAASAIVVDIEKHTPFIEWNTLQFFFWFGFCGAFWSLFDNTRNRSVAWFCLFVGVSAELVAAGVAAVSMIRTTGVPTGLVPGLVATGLGMLSLAKASNRE